MSGSHLLFVVIFLSAALFGQCDLQSDYEESIPYRLPNTTFPNHYDIKISTKLSRDNFTFDGIVNIQIEAVEDTKEIVLHSKKSEIKSVELFQVNGTNINVDKHIYNKFNEFLTIILKDATLVKGNLYNLVIHYSSYLREDKLGFYRSSYLDDKGNRVWVAATQFAPTEARHAFPCYDEPRLKATFRVEITHPTEFNAISNTDIDEGRTTPETTIFKITPIMSTYLIGFVVSDFENITSSSKDFIQEVYARSNAIKYANYSENYGMKVLQTFNDFFEEKFVFPKMKHVALPDFHFNGMENWGITTYKETSILFDPKVHTSRKELIAITLLSHEMAHNWFGNLVTMKWWTYVWLKEGFASLYQYYGPDNVLPNYNIMEHFLINAMHFVFNIDSTQNTRPMTHYVEKQPAIMKNYDRIAYEKSSCVLRMMDHAIGRETFNKAINLYLNENKFNSTEENDLFHAFETANPELAEKIELRKMFKTWTSQKGYPVLTATRNYEEKTLTLTQERFLNSGQTDEESLWYIPFNYAAERGGKTDFTKTEPYGWLKVRKSKDKFDDPGWIVVNVQQTGYYRVNYDNKNWEMLTEQLKKDYKVIHTHNRAQLIDDAFQLASVNKLNYTIAFNLLEYMKAELDYAPWAAFANSMNKLEKGLAGTAIYDKLGVYIRNIVEQPLLQIGFQSVSAEYPLQKITRSIIVGFGCKFGAKPCKENTNDFIEPDLMPIFYCKMMKNSPSETYYKLLNLLENNKDLEVRSNILSAFGCAENEDMLNLSLLSTGTTTTTKLSADDKKALLRGIYTNSQLGLRIIIKHIVNEWKYLKDVFSNNDFESLIGDVASYVNSNALKEMFDEILNSVEPRLSTIDSIRATIADNMRWQYFAKPEVVEYLKSVNGAFASSPAFYLLTFCLIFNFIFYKSN